VTPRLGWYLSHYALDDATFALPDSRPNTVPSPVFANTTRSLPMFSLDSSLFLERDMSFRGNAYTHTLEPRAYYVYIPYRDQTRIPVFDSSSRDLSLDQLFAENQYIGVDRINDANQLTLAVTSRFLDQASGAERLQVTLGQRYYFAGQRVTLPGQVARASNSTELLAQVSGQVNNKLRLNAGLQYDTGEGSLTKGSLGAAWRDGPGKLVNAVRSWPPQLLDQGCASGRRPGRIRIQRWLLVSAWRRAATGYHPDHSYQRLLPATRIAWSDQTRPQSARCPETEHYRLCPN
jgi:LPS-assembly protein